MSRAKTARQLLALIVLNPGISVTGLTKRSGLSAALPSRTLTRLEQRGKVEIRNTPEPEHGTVAWRSYPVAQ